MKESFNLLISKEEYNLAISTFLDLVLKLDEKLTKLQQENKQLKEELERSMKANVVLDNTNDDYASIIFELEEWLKEQWYEIEPKGTGINFNCEYDSEEDYVRGMETKSKLDTLKNSLNKIQELKEKYK